MPIIAVVGSKKSGKTTAVAALVRGLTKRGYKVATAKHIPEPDFTIDTKGKDTWRHTEAGAQVTLSVAPNELALIKKVDTTRYGLAEIIKHYNNDADIIILEGFRALVAQNPFIPKVITAKTMKEVNESTKHFKPIIAFAGAISATRKRLHRPCINALQQPEKLVEIVENKITPMMKKEKRQRAAIKIEINGNRVPLALFVQKFTRSVVLSMVSTLRDVSLEGNENVAITITSPSA